MRRRRARLGIVLLVSGTAPWFRSGGLRHRVAKPGRRPGIDRARRLILNPSAPRKAFLYPHLFRLFVTILQAQAAACDSMDIDLTSLAPAPDKLPGAGAGG
jgi:hypothetical protein